MSKFKLLLSSATLLVISTVHAAEVQQRMAVIAGPAAVAAPAPAPAEKIISGYSGRRGLMQNRMQAYQEYQNQQDNITDPYYIPPAYERPAGIDYKAVPQSAPFRQQGGVDPYARYEEERYPAAESDPQDKYTGGREERRQPPAAPYRRKERPGGRPSIRYPGGERGEEEYNQPQSEKYRKPSGGRVYGDQGGAGGAPGGGRVYGDQGGATGGGRVYGDQGGAGGAPGGGGERPYRQGGNGGRYSGDAGYREPLVNTLYDDNNEPLYETHEEIPVVLEKLIRTRY
ncbi:hypothetical protein BV898_16073 [Hypsibius exemplaris]|uniref:Uncharacterized protein n=1 Tax=Hypsibius exemplaris TaxID=2072580 RepID=A0A9X6NEM2_HYPEX|nr:hypothetical protein BV898_16073 [Hypsibius exemplaris]